MIRQWQTLQPYGQPRIRLHPVSRGEAHRDLRCTVLVAERLDLAAVETVLASLVAHSVA